MTTNRPFEAWELPTRIALSDQGLGYHCIDPIITDVRAHCEYTGQSPYEAFGDPLDFAAITAAEQPPELREKVDRHGLTATGHLTGELFVLSLVAVALPLFFAVKERTWTFPATTAALTGITLLILAVFGASAVPDALRAADRPHLVKFSYLGTGAFGLAAVAAFAGLPHQHLFRVPALAIVALALVSLYLLTRTPRRPADSTPYVPPTPRRTRPTDAEAWMTRLTGLLIGRHDLDPKRAGDLARDAHAHAAESGRTPQEEFGPVEEYALKIARDEPIRKQPFHRTRPGRILGAIVGVLGLRRAT